MSEAWRASISPPTFSHVRPGPTHPAHVYVAVGSSTLAGQLSFPAFTAALGVEIKERRRSVERLSETTWGVVLHEGEQGRRFVVRPKGTLEYPPWKVGGGLPSSCRASKGAE